jgi:hypothetical protein
MGGVSIVEEEGSAQSPTAGIVEEEAAGRATDTA